jgi:hypothetical protein
MINLLFQEAAEIAALDLPTGKVYTLSHARPVLATCPATHVTHMLSMGISGKVYQQRLKP